MSALPVRALRRDAEHNRATLLTAAQRLLARDAHASMEAIAREAGLSRRAVYGHFADREALLGELVRLGAERFNAIAAAVPADDGAGAPIAIARLTARLWDEAAQVQVAAAIALDDAHVQHTAAALAPLRRRLLDLVLAGQEAQSLRTDIPAGTLARLIEETGRMIIIRLETSSAAARLLAVRTVLSVAGLSWRESDELLSAHPDLTGPE
ncbi:TetR/AcrR family transcriptional regulator [Microbacterium caowuchunii]|uniref:TetR/AcrR family transcriptional regulator n=1 Tax=Microbacterium caowuchunii TaxID=2614638 RepID=A0A5N0TK64_9MICO|nr:TetR/AcrR family transcriptional regulator [Microbacterium caowuchunii]KAA9134527.1 TetR/AcrR family transcriptional regulator [Microbacterium caowuchunii]